MQRNKPWMARRAFGLKHLTGLLALLPALALAGSNLVVNGGFDSTNGPLYGWKFNYADTGNKLYANNHRYVSVTNDGSRQHVLELTGDSAILSDPGQGVMVDSAPIPFQPGGKYRLTVSTRTTGANCRILAEGYRWRPGIKPHPHPTLSELRKCYRFNLVYFSSDKTGPFGNPGPTWARDSRTFPEDNLSALAQESLNKVQFLVIHIIAISGVTDAGHHVAGFYSLFVDDVVLEKLN